ncbi:MAG: DMT family transporter [Thermoplasmatota archaeon]
MSPKKIGVISVLLASLMWALEPVLAKLSYAQTDFVQTSAIRAIVVAIVALFYVLISRGVSLRIKKKEAPVLLYIAFVGTLFADLLYFYALISIPVVNAVLIGHLQPLFIILLSFLVLKTDRLNRVDYLGIMLMMISAVFVTTKTLTNAYSLQFGSIGDAVVLLATIAWATTAIAMRKYLTTLHAGVITFYRFFIAALVFGFFITINNMFVINIFQIAVGIVVGIGTICYYEGLKRLKAAQVSGLELGAPVFAAIIGFLVLEEKVTWMQFSGIMLLILGITLLSKKEKKTHEQNDNITRLP